MIKVLIVEDNPLVRELTARIIGDEREFSIAGTAESGKRALTLLEEGMAVDILLTDLNMSDMDGIELTRETTKRYPGTKVVILTMHSKKLFLQRAVSAGVRGYMLKDGEINHLIASIKKIFAGEIVLHHSNSNGYD